MATACMVARRILLRNDIPHPGPADEDPVLRLIAPLFRRSPDGSFIVIRSCLADDPFPRERARRWIDGRIDLRYGTPALIDRLSEPLDESE